MRQRGERMKRKWEERIKRRFIRDERDSKRGETEELSEQKRKKGRKREKNPNDVHQTTKKEGKEEEEEKAEVISVLLPTFLPRNPCLHTKMFQYFSLHTLLPFNLLLPAVGLGMDTFLHHSLGNDLQQYHHHHHPPRIYIKYFVPELYRHVTHISLLDLDTKWRWKRGKTNQGLVEDKGKKETWKSDLPSEIEEWLDRSRNRLFGPGKEVELSHGPCLVGGHVFQVQGSNHEILTPNVFGYQVNFIVSMDSWPFFWPVTVTKGISGFHASSQHNNGPWSLLPNHLMEGRMEEKEKKMMVVVQNEKRVPKNSRKMSKEGKIQPPLVVL